MTIPIKKKKSTFLVTQNQPQDFCLNSYSCTAASHSLFSLNLSDKVLNRTNIDFYWKFRMLCRRSR